VFVTQRLRGGPQPGPGARVSRSRPAAARRTGPAPCAPSRGSAAAETRSGPAPTGARPAAPGSAVRCAGPADPGCASAGSNGPSSRPGRAAGTGWPNAARWSPTRRTGPPPAATATGHRPRTGPAARSVSRSITVGHEALQGVGVAVRQPHPTRMSSSCPAGSPCHQPPWSVHLDRIRWGSSYWRANAARASAARSTKGSPLTSMTRRSIVPPRNGQGGSPE